jgi:serine/threonine protein phosphatase PrpC
MVSLRIGQVTTTGNYRENNEDCCVVDEQQRFVVVADGMGGQSAGEKASGMAVELISQRLLQSLDFDAGKPDVVRRLLDKAIEFANAEIMAISEVDASLRNMGTTVVLLTRVGDRVFVGGVGDSRVYHLRRGTMSQLTTDHSLTQALIEAGTISADEAKTHRYRNVLYRYLGAPDGSSGLNATDLALQPGDRFLLCSDGVNDGLEDDDICALLKDGTDPQEIAEAIVQAALNGGSKDNITSAVVFVEE